MKGQFEFNEDVGGLFINIIACYFEVVFNFTIFCGVLKKTLGLSCQIQRWRAGELQPYRFWQKNYRFIGARLPVFFSKVLGFDGRFVRIS